MAAQRPVAAPGVAGEGENAAWLLSASWDEAQGLGGDNAAVAKVRARCAVGRNRGACVHRSGLCVRLLQACGVPATAKVVTLDAGEWTSITQVRV